MVSMRLFPQPCKGNVPGRLKAAAQARLPRGNCIYDLRKVRIMPSSSEQFTAALNQLLVGLGNVVRTNTADVFQGATFGSEPVERPRAACPVGPE